ncbi:MAG: 50S ribosomal protein L18Ae [Candidatus Lokiarchaeota archaeon]|jgi:ribosomal protein L20A (L18A)|nr:50S ribosomal protein L18Ae [Candidatus Lokiarchaeota archaeon]
MSEIKIYRIVGTYNKNYRKYLFRKEVRAMKKEDALEKALSQITSIGIFRRQIKIKEIREITVEETRDYLIRELSQ